MTGQLWVRYRDKWRRVVGTIQHPTGARYALEPLGSEPCSVLIEQIEHTSWRSPNRKPEPKLVS